MSVVIKVQFSRTVPSSGVYQVQADIIDAENIPMDVFVFDVEHGNFSHVASVYDMETYPVGVEAAQAAELAYFRHRGVSSTFCSAPDALEFETVTQSRLNLLASYWEQIRDHFPNEEIVTIES